MQEEKTEFDFSDIVDSSVEGDVSESEFDFSDIVEEEPDVKKKEQTEPAQAAPLPGLGGVSEEPTPSPSVGQGVLRDVDQTQPTGVEFITGVSDLLQSAFTRTDAIEPDVRVTGAGGTFVTKEDAAPIVEYEDNQKALSEIDKMISGADISKLPVKERMLFGDFESKVSGDLDELKKQRDILAKRSDQLISDTEKDVSRIISSGIGDNWEDFTNELGDIDVSKIGDFARQEALNYGLPEDGYFFERVKNAAKAKVEMEKISQTVDAFLLGEGDKKGTYEELYGVKPEDDAEAMLSREDLRKSLGLSKLDAEFSEQMAQLNRDISRSSTQEIETISQDRYGMPIDEYVSQLGQGYERSVNEVESRYSSLIQDGNFVGSQDQYDAYQQELQSVRSGYESQFNDVVSQNMRDVAAVNNRANRRFNRQRDEILEAYRAEYQDKAKAINPTLQDRYQKAYNKALDKAMEVENIKKESRAMLRGKLATGSFMGGIGTSGLISGFSGQISSIFRAMGMKERAEFWEQAAINFDIGDTEIKGWKDILDPKKLIKSTSFTIGGMTPMLAASMGVGAVTGGAGAPATLTTLAAGGAGWGVETMSIVQDSYDQKFKETGSVAKAEDAANKAFNGQVMLMPMYAVEMVPFFGNVGGKLAKLKMNNAATRFLAGGAIETVAELGQEYPQQLIEKAIADDKELSAALDYASVKGFESTVLNVAPTTILLGGAGAAVDTKTSKEDLAKSLAMRINIGELTDTAMEQKMLKMTVSEGQEFAKAFVAVQLREGNITEEQANKAASAIESGVATIEKAKEYKLNNENSYILATLDLKLKAAQAKAEAETDPMMKSIAEDRVKAIEKQANQVVKTGNAEVVLVEYPDGDFDILTYDEARTSMTNEEFMKSFVAGDIKFEAMGEGQKKLMSELQEKAKAMEPEAAPVEDTQEQKRQKAIDRNERIEKALAILEPIASAREELTVEQLAEVSEILGEELAGDLISDQISKAPDAVDLYNLLDDNKVKIDDTQVTEQERLDTEEQRRKEDAGQVQEPEVSEEEGAADTVLQEEEELESTTEEELDAIDKELSDQGVVEGALTGRSRKRKVVKAVRNGIKAVSKVLPNVTIKLYETQDEYEQATGKKGRGFYNFKEKSISINLESANTRTVAHEIFHALLFDKISTNEEAASISAKLFLELDKVEGKDSKILKELEEFASLYKEDGVGVMTEEKLAEYLGKVAENYDSLSARGKRAVREFVNSMLELIGKANPETKEFLPSRVSGNEVVDMLIGIGERVAAGEVIEAEDVKLMDPDYLGVDIGEGTRSRAGNRDQLEELFLSDKKPKLKSLVDVANYVKSWAKDNTLFDKDIKDIPDDQIVKEFADHISAELTAWDKVRKSEYVSFYDDDIRDRTNPTLQKYAMEEYGRPLTDSEVKLYHVVSAFASPNANPTLDSWKGFDIFDRWMKTGELSGYSDKIATEWMTLPNGKRIDTGVPKMDKEGKPVRSKVSPGYSQTGLDKFNLVLEKFNGDLDKTMDWFTSKHSYSDIAKMLDLPEKGNKAKKENEYLSKEDGGIGIFGITGAKLGSYILNRFGNFSTVTKDMWYARTMARLAGEDLISVNKKTKKVGAIKTPWAESTKEGKRKRKLADKAFKIVADQRGTSPAMIQEQIWDFEKRVYEKLGANEDASYTSDGLKRGIEEKAKSDKKLKKEESVRKGKSKKVVENDIDFIEAEEGALSDPPVGREQKDYKPKKTQKAYKLFTKGPNGKIFPLFVDANTEVPVGGWIEAAFPDYRFTAPNGNVYVPSRATEGVKEAKATGDSIKIPNQEVRDMLIEAGFLPKGSTAKTIKAVAARPGWHAGDVPVATHIGKELTISGDSVKKVEKGDKILLSHKGTVKIFTAKKVDGENIIVDDPDKDGKTLKYSLKDVKGKRFKYRGPVQAWAEIEVPADKDWQSVANDRADIKKDGTMNVKTAHITDEIPFDGFYRYKTNPNMLGNWIISGQIRVNKLLSDSEISKINEKSGVEDIPSLPQVMREEGLTVSDLDKATAKRLKEFYPDDFKTLSEEAPTGRDQKVKATVDFQNRYGKYFSISKIFSNEKHLENYIDFMERKGNKEIGIERGVDVPDVSPTQPFAGREQKNAPLFSGKNKNIIDLANKYIAKKGLAAPEDTEIRRLNTEYSKAMADVYEAAKDAPLDEDVQKAYKALAKESKEQFEVLKKGGYIVELWDGANEPYKNSTEMVEDLKDNKHLYVFSTEEGFGETGITPQNRRENPMLADSGYKDVNGKKLLLNDLFRFVHDAFGHGKLGNSFGPVGEENAWYVHSQMFSPDARRAMTSETRGQNSWVNFGPQLRNKDGSLPKRGDKNYVPLSQRDFAPQKNFLFPDEYVFDRPNTQGRFEGRDQKVKVDKSTIKKNVVAAVDFIKKAALKIEDGVTLNIDGTRYDGGGLVVPISSMNVEQGTLKPSTVADFVEMNKGKLSNDTFKLGLYKFPKESTVSIDLSVIVPNENRKLALSVGKKLNQESLFDLDTGENIKTGGTGQSTVELTDEQAAELATSLVENKEPKFLGREQKTKEKKRGFLGRNIEKLKFYSNLSESVFEDPEAFYEPQVLAEIKENAKYMSDSELIEAMSLDGLNSIMNISGSTNTNMAVLAAAELINRKLAADQDVESVVLQLNKMGTAVGQLMRQFGELKKSTPAGYMLTVERLAEKNNIKLKEADRSKISQLVQAKTDLIKDLNEATEKRIDPNLTLDEQKKLDKEIKKISNELYKVDSELNRFVQTKIPLKLTDTLIQIMQGNLLTTASLAVNILGNVSQLSLMFPVKFIASTFDSLRRFLIGGERTTSFSIPAYLYGAKSFGKTLPDAARILFWKGPRDDFNEMLKGEINNGLLGVRAWMVLMSKGGIPEPSKMSGFDKMLSMVSKEAGEKKLGAKANIALNLIIQGTFGVTADIMFRALQAGDIIFKRPYRDMSLYEIGKRKGLSGEKLKNTLKYPSKKELQMADEIAKEGTFQEDSALAKSSKLMTDAMVKAAENLGGKVFAKNIAKLLARSQFPYVKTPANIASFTFKMNVPAIAFVASMNYLRKGDNRKAALNFGIGVTGSMISTVAIGLVANGLIQSMGDDDDPRERALKYSTFPPGTINKSALMRVLNYIKEGHDKGGKSEMGERLRQFYVGEIPEEITVPRSGEDEFMSYLKLGIPGFVMGVYAMEDKDTAKKKAVNPAKENFIESMMGGTLKLPQSIKFISQQSFLQGTSALLNALTGSEYETDRWLTNTFRAVSSIPLPNQLASIARAQRDYLPDYRDEDLSVQFKNVMDDKIFLLRKETPSDQIRVDLWGRKIAQTPKGADPYMYHLGLDPLRNTTAREDNLSFEIYELYKRTGDARSIPSIVDDNFLHTYKGEKRRFNMTVAQTNRLQGIVGSIRQVKAQKLVESPRWQAMDDEQRIDKLSSIYRDATKNTMVEKEKKIIAYNIALGLAEDKD